MKGYKKKVCTKTSGLKGKLAFRDMQSSGYKLNVKLLGGDPFKRQDFMGT